MSYKSSVTLTQLTGSSDTNMDSERPSPTRYVRIMIDGVAYEGTLHENGIPLSTN